MYSDTQFKWFQILMRVNSLNRSVKESPWSSADRTAVYDLKDQIIGKILDERPSELTIELFYVPYYRYCAATKDRAGAIMRQDAGRHPFEYYLNQVELTSEDREDPDRATVEIVITCMGEEFSFHQPAIWCTSRGINVSVLPRKEWINPMDFNHGKLTHIKAEIASILESLQ